jgi:predicted PurR-regulated permease PerM
MSEKKMVRRSVVIALGVICIIFVIILIGAVSFYTFQISSLNSKVNDLTAIATLEESTVWVNDRTVTQTENNYTSWSFTASYAGYILVNVQSSTTNNSYVRVIYSSYVINYDNTVTVGTSGTAAFPFSVYNFLVFPLPTKLSTNVEIRVGNTNTVSNATETVTITYHY